MKKATSTVKPTPNPPTPTPPTLTPVKPPPPKPTVGKDVVGADGLTNEERYKKRQEEKAAKAAAEKARIAELDKDRPEGVSRYLWEKVLKGANGQSFNTTLVTRDPTVRDALVEAGHEDWVKAIHEQAMDSAASHYMGNGASAADAWKTAQNDWYTKKYGGYNNETVANASNDVLGFGGSTGAPSNPEYVAPEPPPPPTGNPGGMFGGLTDVVNGTRTPDTVPVKDPLPTVTPVEEPPATAEDLQASYAEQLAAARAAQQAAYEQQLAAQQAAYEQQMAAQQAAYEQRQADAEAARQAEIDRRAAEALAQKEANTASWASANASAAGVASSAPAYTRKYGEGPTAGVGLLSGVNSVRGNPANPNVDRVPIASTPKQSTPWADSFERSKKAAEAPGAVSGMMKKWME